MEDLEPRRPRGRRQRAHALIVPAPPSALAKLLLTEWAWGKMSPQMMQKVASAAKIDAVVALLV